MANGKARKDRRFADQPGNGETVAEVADLGATVTAAIDAAVPAQAWAARTAKDRAMAMRRWYELTSPMPRTRQSSRRPRWASRSPRRAVRSPMAPPLSTGSPRASPGLRRRHGSFDSGQALPHLQAACRRSSPYAVEFPDRDDHPQGRRGSPPAAPACSSRPNRRRCRRWRCGACERAGIPAGIIIVTGMDAPAIGRHCDNDRIRKMTFTG